MQNAITTLRIQNFKSIKDITMQPRRVNIIIGEPNVGKSNILEALSLLGGMAYEQTDKFMGSFIRYEEPRQLFYDSIVRNSIVVATNNELSIVGKNTYGDGFSSLLISNNILSQIVENGTFKVKPSKFAGSLEDDLLENFSDFVDDGVFSVSNKTKYIYSKFNSGFFKINSYQNSLGVNTRLYIFKNNTPLLDDYRYKYLSPPSGKNLINTIQFFPDLRQEVTELFKPYGLKVQIRMDERKLEVVKDLNGFVYSYLYTSTADTLQRLIFYLAAIESNDDAVLLFEEPEAHSFPSYIMHLAQSIVDSRNNQFFVVTHNPYLLTEVLEEMMPDAELRPELAIFAAYYEDYQTKVYQLTDEDMVRARADGLDFFLNLRRFVPEAE